MNNSVAVKRAAPNKAAVSKKKASQKRRRIFDAVWSNALTVILAILWLIPVIYVIIFSFSDQKFFIIPNGFLPTGYTFNNYISIFTQSDNVIKFTDWYVNTLILSLCNCILVTFFTVITAFVLSRFRFKGRKFLMNVTMILGMFPGFMSMVAVFLILNLIGLIDSYWAMLLYWVAGAGLGYFVTKGYFDTISNDIDEAAKLDGASQARLFFQIYIPLAKPVIIYTALTAFMAPWADYILSSIVITSSANRTIGYGLYSLMTADHINTYFTRFCAASVVVALPIVVLYIALQRFFVAGISAGAVKG